MHNLSVQNVKMQKTQIKHIVAEITIFDLISVIDPDIIETNIIAYHVRGDSALINILFMIFSRIVYFSTQSIQQNSFDF